MDNALTIMRIPGTTVEKVPTLRQFIEVCSTLAGLRFDRTGECHPMWHAETATETLLITTPIRNVEDKDTAVDIIRQLFVAEGVNRYVFLDEAWVLEAKTKDISEDELNRIAKRGLEHHPDRREVVTFIGENAHEQMVGMRYILRPEHGKPTLSPLKIEDGKGGISSGRMVGLLVPEGRPQ